MSMTFWSGNYSKNIRNLLIPLNLHSLLEEGTRETFTEKHPISIKQIVSNTLKIGSRLQTALMELGRELNIKAQTFQAKTGAEHESFLANISTDKDDFILLQVHGIETEERLLEAVIKKKMAGKLIVYIHRPEELILRVALEENSSYMAAKSLVAKKLKKANAIVLPGDCFIHEYQKMLPWTIVTAIPLGFTESYIAIDMSRRLASESVVCIGSHTTWGEMRHIKDLLELLKALNKQNNNFKILGCALGKFDCHASVEQYINNPKILFLSNKEICNAFRRGFFADEIQFRDWLYTKANRRLIIRAKIENDKVIPDFFSKTDKLLYQWESHMIDFNVQMYREVLDAKREPENRGLPKVEYSGTLHKGSAHAIFVVFDSMAMRDVQENEGLQMILVPYTEGSADFDSAVREIIGFLRDSAKRREVIEKNIAITQLIGMKEIAYAFYRLMIFLENMDKNSNSVSSL